MDLKRHTSGILIVVLLAGVGYLLVSLPPTIIAHYKAAEELGPYWGIAYLVAVTVGGALLAGASAWIVVRLWINTGRRRKKIERRRRNPSQLSRVEQERELRDNLAAGGDFAHSPGVSEELRSEIGTNIAAVESKLNRRKLEIVAFGTISSGKSSLLNALAGRELFRTDARGGTTLTRSEIPWPGNDQVILVDTPGLAEVRGEARARQAAEAAKDADLVLFVVDGPLKAYEIELLRELAAMEKRVLVCLNKEDWFRREQRIRLVDQISQQVSSQIKPEDVIAVRARPSRTRVRVLADGTETEETVAAEPDISPLAERMLAIVRGEGPDLLLANLLLQSRGLVEQSQQRVQEVLDRRAEEIVSNYMWAAGGVAAANPIPLLDLAGGSAVTVKMVVELARVYRRPIDVDTVVNLLAQLSKNLIGMLGVTAATPMIVAVVASMLKTVPGVGTIAGGLVQGLVQALITRWIGKVFIAFFRAGMTEPGGRLAELAREKWDEVTRPDQLIKLIQTGRRHLQAKDEP